MRGGCSIHDQRRVNYILSEEGVVYMIKEDCAVYIRGGCSIHDLREGVAHNIRGVYSIQG